MTLEELKDKIKLISLAHKSINGFDYGEDFLLARGAATYPMVFVEIPYNLSYQIANGRFKTFQFALLVLMPSQVDNLTTDHQGISQAETIGDAIITRLINDLKPLGVSIDNISGLSLREFSDDNVNGFRFDVTAKTFRSYCNNNYSNVFTDL